MDSLFVFDNCQLSLTHKEDFEKISTDILLSLILAGCGRPLHKGKPGDESESKVQCLMNCSCLCDLLCLIPSVFFLFALCLCRRGISAIYLNYYAICPFIFQMQCSISSFLRFLCLAFCRYALWFLMRDTVGITHW